MKGIIPLMCFRCVLLSLYFPAVYYGVCVDVVQVRHIKSLVDSIEQVSTLSIVRSIVIFTPFWSWRLPGCECWTKCDVLCVWLGKWEGGCVQLVYQRALDGWSQGRGRNGQGEPYAVMSVLGVRGLDVAAAAEDGRLRVDWLLLAAWRASRCRSNECCWRERERRWLRFRSFGSVSVANGDCAAGWSVLSTAGRLICRLLCMRHRAWSTVCCGCRLPMPACAHACVRAPAHDMQHDAPIACRLRSRRAYSTTRGQSSRGPVTSWTSQLPDSEFLKNHGITILYLYIKPNANPNTDPIEYCQRINSVLCPK